MANSKMYCQKWDSNPRPQSGLRPERSALDRSAILTCAHLNKVCDTVTEILLTSSSQLVLDPQIPQHVTLTVPVCVLHYFDN